MRKIFLSVLMMAVMMPNLGIANTPATPPQTPPTQTQATKVNFSPIFVGVSDVMTLAKNGETDKAKGELAIIYENFQKLSIDDKHNELKTTVLTAFDTALRTPNADTLQALSTALYTLEKAQNPVDYTQANERFASKITPALATLGKAINAFKTDKDLDKLRLAYDNFNRVWVANERVVRNTQKSHYGTIETAMALLRVAIETQNTTNMDTQFHALQSAIDSYIKGKPLTIPKMDENVDLAYGIRLLEQGLDEFQNSNITDGQAKLSEFITSWAVFEGEVATRNPTLYTQIESQIPIIMAKGDIASQDKLSNIINDLKKINPTAHYTAVDSMLILLREGLEALLIVMALITALNASGQKQGKKWVYGGVGVGLVGSVAGAVAFYTLFPQMASGANREMLEGVVGIGAVVMMVGVGAWLHSKSSVKAWNAYIQHQLGKAMTTGSFVSLFLLSFLSVFREGAETILFYVGILPAIAMSDFLIGIGLALGILAVVAILLFKTSLKLPIPLLFKILTVTIYLLGFKILGVSILALQLTNHLPRTMLDFTALPMIGIYPSMQGLLAQGLYVAIIAFTTQLGKQNSTKQNHNQST
ncbi:FTR1 family iron permease [Moraxella oblonga]|uniref:FTR1 family iron permease n=1 Tax=Moraxella oblonga TaxID=200413 RepID=UPI000A0745EF|nr:FTR1 family protein [Moraxella oblonga]